MLSLKLKLSKGSTFTFMCDLSYIASILFANVNFTHDARKNYATVKIDEQQTKRNVGKFFERRRKTGISVMQLRLFCFLLEISACILGTWFQSYISWIIRSLR